MYSPLRPAIACIRIRSPSMAPPVKGLEGSIKSSATRSPRSSKDSANLAASVLLPAPGGPVIPIRRARLPSRANAANNCKDCRSPASTMETVRARARISPLRKLCINSFLYSMGANKLHDSLGSGSGGKDFLYPALLQGWDIFLWNYAPAEH